LGLAQPCAANRCWPHGESLGAAQHGVETRVGFAEMGSWCGMVRPGRRVPTPSKELQRTVLHSRGARAHLREERGGQVGCRHPGHGSRVNVGPHNLHALHPAGCTLQGAGRRVQGAGCRVQGAGCRAQGAGRRAQGAGRRVQGAGCRVQGAGCRDTFCEISSKVCRKRNGNYRLRW